MSANYVNLRLLLAALLCTCGLANLSAQDRGDIKFGIQASPTISWMNTNNNFINGDGSNVGLKLGLLGDYYFTEQYSIHAGLGFHFNAGGTLFYEDNFTKVDIWREALEENLPVNSTPDTSGGVSYKYSLQYLELPIGMTLRTREFGYFRYFVRPTLNIGVLTQGRGVTKGYTGLSADDRFDISSAVNGFNLSWSLGAGTEYAVSPSTSLVAGIAYQSGFADVTKDKNTSVAREGRNAGEDDSRGKVNAIVITLGVMF